jgi:glycosyltransferase involved in cell wall biosynthesis
VKIVHVVPYKLNAYSGVYTAIVGLTGALARAGHEVEAWNLSPWPEERPELADELDATGVVRRELPESSRPWSLTAAAKQMIDAELDADIVHLHSAFSPQNNLLARRTDRPLVLSPHGVLLPGSLGKSTIRKQVYRRLIELPALKRIAAVCALTESEAIEVRTFGYEGRIEILPNGVSVPLGGVDSNALRRALGLGPEDRIALYVGRIQIDHKRLDAMARAVAAAPGWQLVVVGSDYRGDAARLASLVAGLSGADRIHLVGPKRGVELAEAYSGADVFVLLSHSEGMSMALLEALSYALPPVVSSEVEEALPVAASGSGWVATGDTLPDVLAGAGALSDDGWAERRAAAQALASGYSWQAVADGYLSLYESVIA